MYIETAINLLSVAKNNGSPISMLGVKLTPTRERDRSKHIPHTKATAH